MENFIQITVFSVIRTSSRCFVHRNAAILCNIAEERVFYFIHPTGPYFLFNSTDDSLTAQSSVETKRKASQQQTELHEGTCSRTIYKL